MNRTLLQTLSALLLMTLSSGVLKAGAITVDGNWNDWGIDPNSGDWTASTGSRIFWENYTGTDGTAHLGPGYGGQFFDVEAMYATWTGNTLCYAIVTGFDPDGILYGGQLYTPGDIFVSTGGGWNVGIDLQTGHIYTNPTYTLPGYTSSGPFTITGGGNGGTSSLVVPFNNTVTEYHSGDQSSHHYFYEGCFDLGQVGALNATSATLHWTMSCGNDVGEGSLPKPSVPEPATLGLLGIGGLATLIARKRSARK